MSGTGAKRIGAIEAGAAVLLLGLAACSSPPAGDRGDAAEVADVVDNADNVAAPGNDAEAVAPAKSILRPEVAASPPEQEAPRAEDVVVGFDEAGKTLTDEAKAALDALVASPAARAGGAFTLRGHSDSRGDDRANLRASRRRAETVRDYLAGKGIDPARQTVIALGETTPLVPNAHPDGSDDPAARQKNRRVEVHVAPPARAPAPAATPAAAGEDAIVGNASAAK
ncbi:OmpA family protein [Sphingomonas sp. BK580]|uniref:OmpA family protein n=1 Tax=Sphingomonas sp. BK580 TaxID=2586972 RepID=UPI0016162010|nr:OmpA family protein [Sphingomonas sp. BK580]MBB3693762.1 OOP family OmpA-OmpF porin [Sphingomonas sp. BK580]